MPSSLKQPTRTTKLNQKLVLFPEEDVTSEMEYGAAPDASSFYLDEEATTKTIISVNAPSPNVPLYRVTSYCTGRWV